MRGLSRYIPDHHKYFCGGKLLPCYGCGRVVKLQDIAKHAHVQCDVLTKTIPPSESSSPKPPSDTTPTHARKSKSKPKTILTAQSLPDSPAAAMKLRMHRRLQPVDETSAVNSAESPASALSSPQKRRHRHTHTASDTLLDSNVASPLSVGAVDLTPDSTKHASRHSPDAQHFAVTLDDLVTPPASSQHPIHSAPFDGTSDVMFDDVDSLISSLATPGALSGTSSPASHRPVGSVSQKKYAAPTAGVEDHDEWTLEGGNGRSTRVKGDFIRRTGLSGVGEAIGGNKSIRKYKE